MRDFLPEDVRNANTFIGVLKTCTNVTLRSADNTAAENIETPDESMAKKESTHIQDTETRVHEGYWEPTCVAV
jgi:hypothetical protein